MNERASTQIAQPAKEGFDTNKCDASPIGNQTSSEPANREKEHTDPKTVGEATKKHFAEQ